MKPAFFSLLFSIALAIDPARAAATESAASVALLAGYGDSNQENMLGPGLGLRGGYRFESGVYAGGLVLTHLGSKDDFEDDVGDGVAHHAQSLRAELGYSFGVPEIEVRPSVRAGFALATTARDLGGPFISPELGLGLTLLIPVNKVFFGVDVEGRYFSRHVSNGDASYSITSLGAYATVGYQF